MSQELYSVEQVAERLGLHVRTVRAYIRDGRLKAVRLGKAYRIVRGDLEAFMGPAALSLAVRSRGHVEVSSIVEIEGLDREAAIRTTNVLLATANSRRPDDVPLRVETIYDEDRRRLQVILVGGLSITGDLLKLIGVWTEAYR